MNCELIAEIKANIDKCEDKFWNIFKKDEQKAEVSKNANEP